MTKKWSLRLERNTSSFISWISKFFKDEPRYQDNSQDLGYKNQLQVSNDQKNTCWKKKESIIQDEEKRQPRHPFEEERFIISSKQAGLA